ncbi:hypothetical protein [Mesorhizobium caraganae]|uniref:hypothetical protein n=1 Tax=Mesorhizobium caraganae TaxID=483206 RepID=UPI00177EC0F8|nr:hypothetical protein [Mesorhizobium caraganae]
MIEVRQLQWSDPAPPTEGICSYDHCFAKTPFGKYQIEWKSWKDYPGYVTYGPSNEFDEPVFYTSDTLEEAKQVSQNDFINRVRMCEAIG